MMGEAGPEAVMPLTRTSDGRLGVIAQTHQPTVRLVVDNTAARDARPANGGGDKVTVNIVDQSGARIETTERRGRDGSRQVDVLVRRVEDHLVGKYGLQEPVRRR